MKEYYKGELSIEEEYLNGKLNGKQKVYCTLNGKLRMENEYINGILLKRKKYNNDESFKFEIDYFYGWKKKGKAYIKGKLEYEGECIFGRKYNGKGYDENGNIIYELTNGNGKVKEYDEEERLIFDGEYLNGRIFNGIFKKYRYDGIILEEVEFKNGKIIKLK